MEIVPLWHPFRATAGCRGSFIACGEARWSKASVAERVCGQNRERSGPHYPSAGRTDSRKRRCAITFTRELKNIPALQGCVTVICAMTLFDYPSAWSVVQRDGEQLIPRPSKARMLGAALYSIEPGIMAFGQAARDGGGASYLAPLPLRRACGGAISSGRHRIDYVR
jgi:hypothetical protein